MIATVKNLVTQSKLPISYEAIEERLGNHPNYPSLLALSHALVHWNIKSLAVNLVTEQLQSIPLPAVAHLALEGEGAFVLITKVEDNIIHYIDSEQGDTLTTTRESFSEQWSGYVLLLEVNEHSGENDYIAKQKTKKRTRLFNQITFLSTILIAIGLILINPPTLKTLLVSILSVIGLGTSFALFFKDTLKGKGNAILNKVCESSSKTSCQRVLNSPAAKIFSLKLSEIGIVYFAGFLIAILLTSLNASYHNIYFCLLMISALALPYTLFSIFYQWLVVKHWCPLCLVVQALLWGQFIALYLFIDSSHWTTISMYSICLMSLCFLIPLTIWQWTKPLILKLDNSQGLERQVEWFRKENAIFNTLLTKQPKYDIENFSHEIVFGAEDANHELVVATNLSCSVCEEIHHELEAIPLIFDDVKVKIRFGIKQQDSKVSYLIDSLLFNNHPNPKEIFLKAFATSATNENDSYKRPVTDLIEQHMQWWRSTNLNYTPAIFLNGRLLPRVYSIEDVKVHLFSL